jgi:transcriptional regulator with XRE-family HTH domain
VSTDDDDPTDEVARALNEAIGKRIKLIRVTNGHSQEALGRVLNITFQQVQKYERGANRISADKLWRVAAHYNVELEYFFQEVDATALGIAKSAEFESRGPHERLRLEIGREARHLPPQVLRAILNLMRAANGGNVADV